MARRGKDRFLIEAAFSPATLRRYKEAVSAFFSWCSVRNLRRVSARELDQYLNEYFHYLFRLGRSKGDAVCTYYGFFLFDPSLKGRLPLSGLALKGWDKLVPSRSHPPMTWELALVVAVRMACVGQFAAAVATLLAFDCLLRVGELTKIRRSDIADSGDARMGAEYKGIAIRLRRTKTGLNQFVEVKNPVVAYLLRYLLRLHDRDLIFGFSSLTFRQVFKSTCVSLGFPDHYVPHSLRHGGATRLHLLGMPLEDILLRGRWSSSASARRYIQSGRALLLTTRVPMRVQALAHRLSKWPLLSILLADFIASQ